MSNMPNSFDDPEKSYRRGFEHGAWEMFQFLQYSVPDAVRAEAEAWIQTDIRNWRLENLRGEAGRKGGQVDASVVPPPAPDLRRKIGR